MFHPDKELESLNVYDVMSKVVYGDMPVQIGYCNGHNQKLNAVEYHRSSEINVAATDMILLLGKQQDIKEDYTYDTADIEAFLYLRVWLLKFMRQRFTMHHAA